MLASITPLGERSRGFSWGVTASAFAAGAVGAGALAGAAGGALGSLAPNGDWRDIAGLGLVVLALAVDASALRRRLPTTRRQVNEDWLTRYRGWVYGVAFGAQLGTGVVTIVTSAAVYAAALGAVLCATVPAGAAVGAAFGATRALVAASGTRGDRSCRPCPPPRPAWARRSAGTAGGAGGRGGGNRADHRGAAVRTAAHGLSVDVPVGWEARIVRPPESAPYLHVASFALIADSGQFGAGVTGGHGARRRVRGARRVRGGPPCPARQRSVRLPPLAAAAAPERVRPRPAPGGARQVISAPSASSPPPAAPSASTRWSRRCAGARLSSSASSARCWRRCGFRPDRRRSAGRPARGARRR